jgi:hypothetical protein
VLVTESGYEVLTVSERMPPPARLAQVAPRAFAAV